MIYFVDEDELALGAYAAELRLRGYRVAFLRSAREAFRTLWNASRIEVELVVIDVMLAPGDANDRRDTAEATQGFTTTGLELVRDLADQNPDVFPARAVLFTSAVGDARRAASTCAGELEIELWDKHPYLSPVHFADDVARLLTSRGE